LILSDYKVSLLRCPEDGKHCGPPGQAPLRTRTFSQEHALMLPQGKKSSTSKTPTKRTIVDPYRVKPVTDNQVRQIIVETYPKMETSPELICSLRHGINDALRWITPRLDGRQAADFDDIRQVLEELKKKLHLANLRLLAQLGSAALDQTLRNVHGLPWERRFRPRDRTPSIDKGVLDTLDKLKKSNDEVLAWLADKKAADLITRNLRPELDVQTLVGHLLPNLFQMCFLQNFGTGRSGPGNRFVVAVLREARVRSGDQDTMAEYIRQARRRLTQEGFAQKK
jgi:hypothetical protein